jgi:hypothetical protein
MVMQETAHLYRISETDALSSVGAKSTAQGIAPLVRRSLYPDSINGCASRLVKILLEIAFIGDQAPELACFPLLLDRIKCLRCERNSGRAGVDGRAALRVDKLPSAGTGSTLK